MTLSDALNVAAAWTAAFGTILASIVALMLARRSTKVRIKALVGIREVIGIGTHRTFVAFSVTNLGERPVTITSLGWRIGKGRRNQRYGLIPFTDPLSAEIPKTLNYGEAATFFALEKTDPRWLSDYLTTFIKGDSTETLRGLVHTTVGYSAVVVPEDGYLRALNEEKARTKAA